jgi:tetratricopeptide (TPR) repeat protein
MSCDYRDHLSGYWRQGSRRSWRLSIPLMCVLYGPALLGGQRDSGGVYTFPNTPTGPEAQTRVELDTFGLVMENRTPAELIAAAEVFRQRFPDSQLLPLVLLQEMRAEIAADSRAGALAIGRELLQRDPNNLQALVWMAGILPDFPAVEAGRRKIVLTEAEAHARLAKSLLRTLRLSAGVSARDFLKNKRALGAELREATAFIYLVGERYQEAIQEYEQVIAYGSEVSSLTRLRLGTAYYHVGNVEQARLQLLQAERDGPDTIRQQASEILKVITRGSSPRKGSPAN